MPLGPPDLSPVVANFSYPVTHQRPLPPGQSSEGYPTGQGYVDTCITMHLHAAPAEVVTQLADGQERSEVLQGYTTHTDMQAGDRATGRLPDRIVHAGATYEVRQVIRWTAGPSGSRSYVTVVVIRLGL